MTGDPRAARRDASVGMVDVLMARRRIAPWVRRTPLARSPWLSALCGADVRLKLECLQVTHAFKARGAFNAALALRERAGAVGGAVGGANGGVAGDVGRGVGAGRDAGAGREAGAGVVPRLVTASTGNHGRALAHAARALGLPCVVFAPASTPATKQQPIRDAGADLRADARDYDDAEQQAQAFAAATGAAFVSPYDDPRIVAGTGTIGLEIVEDDPDVDLVLVPMGGGGLISGVATAVKTARPDARVIGVEAELNPVFHTMRAQALPRDRAATIDVSPTLADALGGHVDPNSLTLDLVERLVDDVVLAREDAIGAAIADLVTHERLVVEGAGAVGIAALTTLAAAPHAARAADPRESTPAAPFLDLRGLNVVVVVTGGNIERARLAALLSADR